MKNLARNIRLSVILTAAFFSASCGSVDEPVNFSTEWPTKSPGYEEAATRWTRRGVLRAPLEQQASQLMEIYATYLSNDWRAAYVERQSKLQKLNGPRKAELAGQQQQTALAQPTTSATTTCIGSARYGG